MANATTVPESKFRVVIGGGNGIGEACCRLMSKRGLTVVVADYDGKAAEAVADAIGRHSYQIDVRDHAGLETLAVEIERDVGPVHSLVISSSAFEE